MSERVESVVRPVTAGQLTRVRADTVVIEAESVALHRARTPKLYCVLASRPVNTYQVLLVLATHWPLL